MSTIEGGEYIHPLECTSSKAFKAYQELWKAIPLKAEDFQECIDPQNFYTYLVYKKLAPGTMHKFTSRVREGSNGIVVAGRDGTNHVFIQQLFGEHRLFYQGLYPRALQENGSNFVAEKLSDIIQRLSR